MRLGAARASMADALRLYDGERLAIRLFVRARHLLAPLQAVAAHVPPVGDVLDVGCGHGLLSMLLALGSPERRVLGVDPSPAKIEVARHAALSLRNVEFRLGSVEAAGEGLFQVVTLLDVLYLLPPEEKLRVLRGCRALLAPDGLLLLKTNDTHPAWKYSVARFQEWAMTTSGLTLGHGGLFFYSCHDNLRLLEEAGFEAEPVHLPHWTPYPHVLFIALPVKPSPDEPKSHPEQSEVSAPSHEARMARGVRPGPGSRARHDSHGARSKTGGSYSRHE